MPKILVLSVAAVVTFAVLPGFSSTAADRAFGPANPLFAPSTLPFQAPPFDRLKDDDYQPAIEAGIRRQKKEISAIANDPAEPTFENTLIPLEKSGRLLQRAQRAFNAVAEADTNPKLQAAKAALAPQLAAHSDAIYLNERLFARVSTLYGQRERLNLDAESRRLLELTYEEFAHSGANLAVADKARLRKLNEEASTLSATFTARVLSATKSAAYHAAGAVPLAGLSDAQLAAAAEAASNRHLEGYLLALQNTTQQPVLRSLQDRATRKAIFESSWNRNEQANSDDTRDIIGRLAQLRAEHAALLGFPNHAAWQLADQMVKTPEVALRFLDSLVPVAAAKVAEESAAIQAAIDQRHGNFTLEPWDWQYYSENVRKAKYDLDEAEVKPYFELGSVLKDGVFYAAGQLYGISFEERNDIPVYHPGVRVFEVIDANGAPLALFYCDYFKRDNKNGGAWMSSFVEQSKLLRTLPVIYNVANLPSPAAGEPALISFDDVRTMFHEFGHALHGMFAATRYPSLSGTATARDFVEFPSQFNEHWASYPAVFTHYAKHFKTGAPMPQDLVEKIAQAANFDEGYQLSELLAAAELDMQWHLLAAMGDPQGTDEFEKQALARAHVDFRAVPPRYRSSYFSHIWAGGYSAGYYAYLWTQMLDDDAYQWFEDHGGLTRQNGDRFRAMVLSRGNTEDLEKMYVAWRGRPPSIDAMLKYRGLTAAEAGSAIRPDRAAGQ